MKKIQFILLMLFMGSMATMNPMIDSGSDEETAYREVSSASLEAQRVVLADFELTGESKNQGTKRKRNDLDQHLNENDESNDSSFKQQRLEEAASGWSIFPIEIQFLILSFLFDKKEISKASTNLDAFYNLLSQYTVLNRVSHSMQDLLSDEFCGKNVFNVQHLAQNKNLANKLFLRAAQKGNIGMLRSLFSVVDVSKYKDNRKLLLSAIGYGKPEFCRYLIDQGMFDDVENKPLIFAIILQDRDAVKALIKKGKKKGMLFGQYTESMVAAAVGNLEIFKLFSPYNHRGATCEVGGYWTTSLQCAARNGHKKIVSLLFDVENDYDDAYTHDYDQCAALIKGASHGHLEVVKFVLSKVDVESTLFSKEYTALAKACKHGHLTMVKYLLKKGALPNQKIYAHGNDIECALTYACQAGDREIVHYLIDHNAKVNLTTSWPSLMVAITSGDREMADLLVDSGANINVTAYCGRTPLMQAVTCGNLEMVKWLVSLGALVNCVERVKIKINVNESHTALDIAIKNSSDEICEFLLEHGAKRYSELSETAS